MTKRLFLTGYEKETIKSFLQKLKAQDISTIIDVREIPLSRKNGFSKKPLSQLLKDNNIKYFHFPGLGSPLSLRKKLKETGDYLDFFDGYNRYVSRHGDLINRVVELVVNNGKSSALLCFERETDLCHRSIIATKVLGQNKKISAIHL